MTTQCPRSIPASGRVGVGVDEPGDVEAIGGVDAIREVDEFATIPEVDEVATADAVDEVDVLWQPLDVHLGPPGYAHDGDAGADLRAAEEVRLGPGQRCLVGTGVAIALPRGYAAFVHPRSGLAAHHGIGIVNAPGTVDADYRGEIKVCLINHDPQRDVTIARGDRIAQLVVQRVSRARFVAVADLPDTVRGIGGHGSTGGMPAALSPVPTEESA